MSIDTEGSSRTGEQSSLKNNQKISAQKKRQHNDGPTVHTLAQKARILGDSIVMRGGKPALLNHFPSDAVDALSWLFSKGLINEFEREAGERMARMRRGLFGFGVVPPPSFYGRMCAFEPDPEAKKYSNREELTDEQKLAKAAEQLDEYEKAMKWLNAAGIQVRMAVQRICNSDWMPEKVDDVIWIRKGLGILTVKWGIGVASMGDRKPTLCLDFDGVIHSYNSGWQGATKADDPPVEGTLEFLARAMEVFKVAIYSSRSHHEGGIKTMKAYLHKHFDEFTKHDVGATWRYMSQLSFPMFKPAAHLSIDDRALCFTGRWEDFDPLAMANFQPWNRKGNAA